MEKKKLVTHFIVGTVLSVIAVIFGGFFLFENTIPFWLVLIMCALTIPFGLVPYMLLKIFVDWAWRRIPHSHSLKSHLVDFVIGPLIGVGGGVFLGFILIMKLFGKLLG